MMICIQRRRKHVGVHACNEGSPFYFPRRFSAGPFNPAEIGLFYSAVNGLFSPALIGPFNPALTEQTHSVLIWILTFT